MNKFFQFLGLVVFILGIGYGVLYLKSNSDIFNEALRILGLLALVALVGYMIARMIWGKNWVIKGGGSTVIGGDLIAAIQQFTKELPTPSKEATASLIGNIIYRFTRIGVFAVLLALIPLALLWQQNQLLSRQNEKIDKQNDLFNFQNEKVTQQTDFLLEQTGLLKTQNGLFEAQNKNVEIQTGLLGTQNEQLVAQNKLFGFQNKKVSEQTALLNTQNEKLEYQNQRVSEQTDLFKKQNEKLDVQIQLQESNRRGALIVMMSNIMDKVDEELKEDWNEDSIRNLSPQLIGRIAALSQSFKPYRFLKDNTLIKVPSSPERGQLLLALINSDLDVVTYQDIYLVATFRYAYLVEANLNKANLRNADLKIANLSQANLSNANLMFSNLFNANLSNANLSNTNLMKADLNYAILVDANLRIANLWYADLKYADLRYADLRYANLEYIQLNNTRVVEKKWLTKLEEWNVRNNKPVLEKYKIDTIPQEDFLGRTFYIIKPKN